MTRPLDPALCAALVQSDRWKGKIVPGEDGCFMWTAYLNDYGYGMVGLNGSNPYVHRVAYVAATGKDIPPGLTIDHLCHDPALCQGGVDCPHRKCVNPAHLKVVPMEENLLRRVSAQSRKTHCPKGHKLTGDNLLPSESKRGSRACAECNRVRSRERAALVRAAQVRLGLTKQQYIVRYGQSRAVAEEVLQS